MPDLWPDQAPNGWNETSTAYDRNIWSLMRPFVLDAIGRARLDAGARVLDVAAGIGALTMEVAGRASAVLAVDFAEDMLHHLKRRAVRAGHVNVRARVMDGQALALGDESFDAVFSNFGLIFFPDRVQGFREMRRVLRPGGRAVVTAWSTPERFEMFQVFLQAVCETVGEPPRGDSPPPVFSLADPRQFGAEMRAGGLDDVRIHTVRHPFEVESAPAFWEMMSSSAPPAVALLERLGPRQTRDVRENLLGLLARRFGDGRVVFQNEAHIGVACRPV
jgi:SAM-dependent methyltransferase